jgi:uncharacterized protein (TIGR02453 family)
MLQSSTLKFLKDLKKNNNKAWFDINRGRFEIAKKDFEQFIQTLIDKQGKNDPTINNFVAKDCIYRINRDVRFREDKSPYKWHFAAGISIGGRQSNNTAGYYFHLEPGGTYVGGGIWMPDPEHLRKLRQEVDYNYDAFKKILSAKKFKSIYGDLSDDPVYKLSRVPKGYEKDNPAAEYLKLKSYTAMIPIKDAELTDKSLVNRTVAAFAALQPVIDFINGSME